MPQRHRADDAAAPDEPRAAGGAAGQRPVVLVTGGARRIGGAIVLELAAHGWDVAVHCRRSFADAEATAADARALGARAEVFSADLADPQACEALLPAVLLRCDRLDAVVHNASLFEYDDVANFTVASFERHMRANAVPAIVLARALHEHLSGRGARGCVVNLLDQKLANPNPDYLSYTLSKSVLEAAGTLLAQALAPTVRVCAVAPGLTLRSSAMSDDEFAAAQQLTPLQRTSTPQDLAGAVRFLLEAPAITGETLLVDGGQHLAPQARDVLFLVRRH
jgi:NAD(P)-dependent dehydrogenase (short-subunit alcohol dehydrogenase family)